MADYFVGNKIERRSEAETAPKGALRVGVHAIMKSPSDSDFKQEARNNEHAWKVCIRL